MAAGSPSHNVMVCVLYSLCIQKIHFISKVITVIDCGVPIAGNGVVIEAFNDSKLDAMITFHCEGGIISMVAVCGSNVQWTPNPSSFECVTGNIGIYNIIIECVCVYILCI